MSSPCLYIRKEGELAFKRADIWEGEQSVSYTKQNNNLEEVLTPRSTFFRDVQLLYTGRTADAMGRELRFDRGVKISQEYEAIMTLDGVDALQGIGKLILQTATFDGTQGCYVVTAMVVSGRALWSPKLAKCFIQDLDFGTHTFDEATVRNSWDRRGLNGTVYDESYIGGVYLPINYGNFTGPQNASSFRSVSIMDLRLSLYVRRIIREGFEKIGWNTVGDWINSDDAAGYIMPYREVDVEVLDNGVFPEMDINDPSIYRYVGGSVWRSFPFTLDDVAVPYWNQPSVGQWQVLYDQIFSGQINVTGQYDSGFFNGLNIEITSDRRGVLSTLTLSGSASQQIIFIPPITLIRHEVISFNIVEAFIGSGERYRIQAGTTTRTQFDVIPLSNSSGVNPQLGQDIDSARTRAGDLSILDVLQGLLESVGLYPITNPAKREVNLVPTETYYNFQQAVDITPYIDCEGTLDDELFLAVCPNRRFKYKDDGGDEALKAAKRTFGKEWGSRTVINDSEDECLEDFENSTFASTYHERAPSRIAVPGSYTRGWWVSIGYPEADNPGNGDNYYKHVPRILYYHGLVDIPATNPFFAVEWQFDNTVSTTTETQLPYGYFFEALNLAPNNENRNLSYDNERIFDFISSTGVGAVPSTLTGRVDIAFQYMVRLLQANRFISLPVSMRLTEVLTLEDDRMLHMNSPHTGTGLMLYDRLEDWVCDLGTGVLRVALLTPDCGNLLCATLEEIGFRFTTTLNQQAQNATYEIRVFLDDPDAIVISVSNQQLTIVSGGIVTTGGTFTFGPSNDPLYFPPLLSDDSTGIFFPQPGGINQSNKDCLNYGKVLLSFDIEVEGKEPCTLTACLDYVFWQIPQIELKADTNTTCFPAQYPDYTMDAETCVQNFIELATGNLAAFNAVMAERRNYQIVEFIYDNQPVPYPFAIGRPSDLYGTGETNQGYPAQVLANLNVQFDDTNPNTANAAFVFWFNCQFPVVNQNPTIVGALGAFTSPVQFWLDANGNTNIRYSTGAEWRLILRKEIPTIGVSFDYLFEWDGVTLRYQFVTTGSPFPAGSLNYLGGC